MCGICGIVRSNKSPVLQSDITSMQSALLDRGPDDSGQWINEGVGFGFQRLAIVDVSPTGHQPMTSPDGRYTIIFNGEIYNYRELRRNLEHDGFSFKSTSDTEVILHGFHRYGHSFIERLVGMFAIALWDRNDASVTLIRDRLGKKPLYYCIQDGTLYFASAIQSITRVCPNLPIQEKVLAAYFRTQSIPSPETIYQGIWHVEPATFGVWRNGTLTWSTYWQRPTTIDHTITEETAREKIDFLVRQAVRDRMHADVPVGVFLSGGLDSSIITALMAEESTQPISTFSVGFAEQSHNELPLARLVAQRYGTQHTEIILDQNIHQTLPSLLEHFGQPFADTSALAVAAIARETKKHVTVALNGDGGDENFAGYDKYKLLDVVQAFDLLPLSMRTAISRTIQPIVQLLPSSVRRKVTVVNRMFGSSFIQRYLDCFFTFTEQQLGELFTASTSIPRSYTISSPAYNSLKGLSQQQLITALDYDVYLRDTLLVKADVASMSASLEARSPFLDHRLIEYTSQLPDRLKLRDRQSKWILRKTFGHLLPTPLLSAPKRGFDLPVNSWMTTSILQEIQERLHQDSIKHLGWFNAATVERLIEEQRSGREFHGNRLWSLYCFFVWYQDLHQ